MHANILYFQSGGPTSVINASFLGLVKEYRRQNIQGHVYVSRFGIDGLLQGKLEEIDIHNPPDILFRPGAYFGSARLRLDPDPQSAQALSVVKTLQDYAIDYVFPNGGNDSMDTAAKLSAYASFHHLSLRVVGIPKTIDNDLYGCDHTPGFATAAKFVANATLSIAMDDATYKQGRVNIIETMGRDSGFLAASSILASLKGYAPDYIYVPEVPFVLGEFLRKCVKTYKEKGRCLVVVSEGIRDKDGKLIATSSSREDVFGHRQVGGVSSYLASLLENQGIKTRAIELSVLNRASSFLPCLRDIEEAKGAAAFALNSSIQGQSGCMVCILREEGDEYAVRYQTRDIQDIANRVVYLPKRYISASGDGIDARYIAYCLPLIQGNATNLDENGLI